MTHVKSFFIRIFNAIVRMDKKSSLFHHFPESPTKYLSAIMKSFISGYLIYAVELVRYRKHLNGLKSLKGSKKGKVALVVANGPSCNKINWSSVAKSQSDGELEILCLNDSIILSENSLAAADFLLKSDPLDKAQLLKDFNEIISKNSANLRTKLITPLNWHAPDSLNSCQSNTCLHLVDVGRNHFKSTTNPLKLRTYPSMGSFKLLSIARYLGYDTVFVIGLDNTFFKNVKVDHKSQIIQGSLHYKDNYLDPHNMSHHFPNGIGDYFHFVSQNFLSLKKYFNDDLFVNLDVDSLNDTFKKIQDGDNYYRWLLDSKHSNSNF